eukprot:CAMPEP_0116061358 /NCGR_PEP_ID=MMETSP0322-20121206/7034_1 /TAXON_ID=163516 /ORGANISM="Leptocylindrus danicus var. apora, Strain B651" /LENGTH=258 /DNA_ID=CAMNT_0003546295 /DNA_START=130 /DNA_END=906 /DNA_ORIENTATION=-
MNLTKVLSGILLLANGIIAAKLPSLSVSITDGTFDGLQGLAPSLSWKGSSSFDDVDVDYGCVVSTSASKELKKAVWTKVVFGLGDLAITTFANVKDLTGATLAVKAGYSPANLDLTTVAKVGKGSAIKNISMRKGFSLLGGELNLRPSLKPEQMETAVGASYENGPTSIAITSNDVGQRLKISREFGSTVVSPIFKSDGTTALELSRTLEDGNSISAFVDQNKDVVFKWKDNGWTAELETSIGSSDTKMKISKGVTLF